MEENINFETDTILRLYVEELLAAKDCPAYIAPMLLAAIANFARISGGNMVLQIRAGDKKALFNRLRELGYSDKSESAFASYAGNTINTLIEKNIIARSERASFVFSPKLFPAFDLCYAESFQTAMLFKKGDTSKIPVLASAKESDNPAPLITENHKSQAEAYRLIRRYSECFLALLSLARKNGYITICSEDRKNIVGTCGFENVGSVNWIIRRFVNAGLILREGKSNFRLNPDIFPKNADWSKAEGMRLISSHGSNGSTFTITPLVFRSQSE